MKIRHLTPRARISATVGVIAVGALALSGCAGDGTSANYVEGGTFVYALGTDIGSLDPALGVTSAALAVGQYAYDPLVHLNEEGEIVAGLAKEWNVDGTTVTLHAPRRRHLRGRREVHRDHREGQPRLHRRPGEREPAARRVRPRRRHDRGG